MGVKGRSPINFSQDVLYQTDDRTLVLSVNQMHRTSAHFFKNQGAKINGFHKHLAQNYFIFTNHQTFQEICDPLAERRLISAAMIFELGQEGVKVATFVCCYPEGKQKCLALNKVHRGSSSGRAEGTK